MQGGQQDAMATRFADNNPMYDPLVEQLQFENDQLRRDTQQFKQLMEEMRQLLQEASEQEQRIQTELTDREGKLKVAEEKAVELQTIIDTKPKTKSELEEWADELERESFQIQQDRRTMEEDRKQLREDEAALEKQMREMEVQMARERAMLARQETELKRLNAEIQHELDLMQRGDGVLRERLAIFQRRHAEVVGSPVSHGASYGHPAPTVATSAHPTPPPKKNDTTGLLRKLFRGGE
jgi:chromosome segregation ATPase